MNKTKFNTTADQTTCRSFQNYSVNLLILQMCIIFTLLAIVISNVALLRKLLKKKQKTRADKIFIILSCSDIGVGLFSIPMMYLELFLCDFIASTMFYFNLLRHFSALSSQLFWDTDHNYCTWQSFHHNKSTSLQKIYYYESFVSNNCICSNIEPCSYDFFNNGENIGTRLSCSVLYINFCGNLLSFYNHYSLRILISLSSVEIKEDSRQKT